MPRTFQLSIAGLEFPRALSRRKSNFRIIADVRYVNGRGEHDTEHSVLPDLDRWWECDPERRDSPDYVRGAENGETVSFDMTRIDDWDRLVLLVRGDSVHSVQLKVFDVNRSDGWDRLRRALGEVVVALIGRGRTAVPERAWPLSDALGTAADDLESALVGRLAGAQDLLFRGSAALAEAGDYEVGGPGAFGRYAVRLELRASEA